MTFVFQLTDKLRSMLEWAKTHPCAEAYTQKPTEPSLFIVKDDGAYLMPASIEKMVDEEATKKTYGNSQNSKWTVSVQQYAEGCTPDDDWIGGDDFAENVPVRWFDQAIALGHTVFMVILTADEMKFQSK